MIRSSPLFALPFRCPVSCLLLAFVTFLNIASGRLLCFHSFSSVSAKVDIRKRKITNDTLSPCLTPTSWSISTFSLPIFTMTLRLVYSLLMLSWNVGGGRIALVSCASFHGCLCHRLWTGPQILHRYPGYVIVGDRGWILVWGFCPDTHSWVWLPIGASRCVLPGVCSSACIGLYWRFLSRHPWGILFGICWGHLGFVSLGPVSNLLGAILQSLLFHPRRPRLGGRLPGGWLRSWLWRLPLLLHLLQGICILNSIHGGSEFFPCYWVVQFSISFLFFDEF